MHVLIGHSYKQLEIKHRRKEFKAAGTTVTIGNQSKLKLEKMEGQNITERKPRTMKKKRTQELGYKPPQNPLKMLPNKRPSGGSSGLYVSPVPQSFGLKQRTQEDQPNRAKKNLVQTQ